MVILFRKQTFWPDDTSEMQKRIDTSYYVPVPLLEQEEA
jgi:hypothetical protein